MQTRYEWTTSPSGEQTIVEVKRHVVAGSVWISPEPNAEVRYERCSLDPNRVIIVERLKQVVKGCEDKAWAGSRGSKSEGDDLEQSSDVSFDEDWDSSSSYHSSDYDSKEDSSIEWWESKAAKARQTAKELEEEIDELKAEAKTPASRRVLLEFIGKAKRVPPKTTRSRSKGDSSLPSTPVASNVPATNAERPSLTRVRLLALLASPGYKQLIHDEGVWVARLCFDREKEETLKEKDRRVSLGCPSFVDLLESTLDHPPEYVRPLEEEDGYNSWMVKLSPWIDDESLGKGMGYSYLVKRDDLLIWQKVTKSDFFKPTTWMLLYLPPAMEILTDDDGEEVTTTAAKIALCQRLTVKDKPFFKTIASVVGEEATGFYTIRAVVDYENLGNHTSQEWFTDPSIAAKLDEAEVWLASTEQCTFCGLDCGYEGDGDEHDLWGCPYKATWMEELSSKKKKSDKA